MKYFTNHLFFDNLILIFSYRESIDIIKIHNCIKKSSQLYIADFFLNPFATAELAENVMENTNCKYALLCIVIS